MSIDNVGYTEECSRSISLKEKIRLWWSNFKYNHSTDRLRYWFIKHCLYKLLNSNNLSEADKHLFREMTIAGWTNKEKIDNVKFLVNLYSILNNCGCIEARDLRMISECWKLLSPLKFTDDEFGEKIDDTRHLEYRQNNRATHVFKYGYNDFRDVDAITWNMKARYDISEKNNPEHKLIAEHSLGRWHASVWIYDEKDDSWMKIHSTHKINLLREYYADKSFEVPFIDIYDSEDTKNDFYCHIANKSSIPQEFYKWFILTDVTNDKEDKQELDFLQKNDMKQLLFKPVFSENVNINKIITNDAKILIEVTWITEANRIKEELISSGIAEKNITISYKDDSVSLVILTNEQNKSIINRIKTTFNYKDNGE